MRRAVIAVGVTGLSSVALLAVGTASGAQAKVVKLEAALRGASDRPAAPRTNRGTAELRLNATTGRVCWEFTIGRVDGRPMQAHIHKGPARVSGNVVVPLGARYKRQGCTTASNALVRAILRAPRSYYVNVHNAKHPLGAMRGQLARGA